MNAHSASFRDKNLAGLQTGCKQFYSLTIIHMRFMTLKTNGAFARRDFRRRGKMAGAEMTTSEKKKL
jgi:hypothetical protein